MHAVLKGLQDRQDSNVHQNPRPCLLVAECPAPDLYHASSGPQIVGSFNQTVSFWPLRALSRNIGMSMPSISQSSSGAHACKVVVVVAMPAEVACDRPCSRLVTGCRCQLLRARSLRHLLVPAYWAVMQTLTAARTWPHCCSGIRSKLWCCKAAAGRLQAACRLECQKGAGSAVKPGCGAPASAAGIKRTADSDDCSSSAGAGNALEIPAVHGGSSSPSCISTSARSCDVTVDSIVSQHEMKTCMP